ncbi:Sterol-sensing domain containing protein [Trichuris trichiura]|uniref:Sterol-sensing domain containing protein n=1 Tax=Trichuris trichiura TaxID=36087 RepID=A0A077YYG3_TRITR|nr:Sterol-sensing domain containing protein [Trichuris trichiura]
MSKFVLKHPSACAVVSFMSGCILTVIPLIFEELPDFSDPTMGFSTRGTTISNRLESWFNLKEHVSLKQEWTRFPEPYVYRRKTKSTDNKSNGLAPRVKDEKKVNSAKEMNRKEKNGSVYCDHCPCTCITVDNAFIVLRLSVPFAYGTFKKLCKLQQRLYTGTLARHLMIDEFCERHVSGHCCHSWSLASIAAQLLDKIDCSELNRYDVRTIRNLIYRCAAYKGHLYNCSDDFTTIGSCRHLNLPEECNRLEVFILYQYLIPVNGVTFRSKNVSEIKSNLSSPSRGRNSLKRVDSMDTLIILPITKQVLSGNHDSLSLLDSLMKECKRMSPTLNLLSVDFGIRESVFKSMLFHDLIYVLLAVLCIFIAVCTYTSLCYALLYVICMTFSFGTSYCIYSTICGVKFFPFVNLLCIILLVGVGVDDAFIFHHAWMTAEAHQEDSDILEVLYNGMANACSTMFITSATTAAAFYSNLLSSIIVVRCFGLFAGTVTLCNYALSIVWLPSATMLLRRRRLACAPRGNVNLVRRSNSFCFQACLKNMEDYIVGKMKSFQWNRWNSISAKSLGANITKLDCYLFNIFLTLGIVCCFLVAVSSGVQLPGGDHFRFFKSNHLLERWTTQLKDKFVFASEKPVSPMKIHIVWGVQENSYAKALDPYDHGFLIPVQFDLWSNRSYLWIRDFCASIALESFIDYDRLPMLYSCFMDDFLSILEKKPCVEMDKEETSCCRNATSSLQANELDFCLKRFLTKYHTQIQEFAAARLGSSSSIDETFSGPLYDSRTGKLKALIVTFFSTFKFSYHFSRMDHFFGTVEKWIKTEIATAPKEINRAWFICDNLNTYDLQLALVNSAKTAVPVAISLSIVILLIMTRDWLLTLMTTVTVTVAIFFLLECLLLLQWEVNVIETTIITLAIGLSFDYTLHYAAMYISANLRSSNNPVPDLLLKTGSPVLMSMLTTILGGACMLFSTVYAYFQIGVFMILLAIVSYCFATFLFLSMISIATKLRQKSNCCCSSAEGLQFPILLPVTAPHEQPLGKSTPESIPSLSLVE